MAAPLYIVSNNAMNTTAAMAGQTTAATVTVRTMLQVVPSSTKKVRIIGWGYEITSGMPAAPVTVEAISTQSILATGLTAHVAAGVQPYNDSGAGASDVQLGTGLTGYTASTTCTEGTITATRLFDQVTDSGLYYKNRLELGREPEVAAGHSFRIRATPGSAAAVTIRCWVLFEE